MYNDHNEEINYEKMNEEIEAEILSEKLVKEVAVKKKYRFRNFTRLTAAALVFGLVAGASFQGYNYIAVNYNKESSIANNKSNAVASTKMDTTATAISTGSTSSNNVTDVSEVVANVMPSIVSITCKSTVNTSDMFGRVYSDEATGSGSGIVIGENDTSVLIATNNHVVEGATSVEITFSDETVAAATVKGTDAISDLAVVSVNLSDLSADTKSTIKIATLGNSDALKTGEQAIAIGNALGYGQSVTVGYISALNREVELESGTMTLLQTDAAINPGNSGGALLNSKGEVIGINSVKYASSEVEGMGYAIPISKAIPIINELMNKEVIPESEKAVLGVQGQDVTKVNAQNFNMPVGVYIAEVTSGSAAEKAGLKTGDIIVGLDDKTIDTMATLKEALTNYKIGDTTKIKVSELDNGTYNEKTVDLTF